MLNYLNLIYFIKSYGKSFKFNNMKKLIVAFAVLVSTLSFAQAGKGERVKGNPEQNVENRLKEMTNDLGLSEKQQSEIKTILLEQSKKRETMRERMKASKEKGVKPSDEQKAEMKKKMIDEQLEMKTKMKKILSEEQLKKWQEIRKEKGKEMGENRKDRKKIVKKEDK